MKRVTILPLLGFLLVSVSLYASPKQRVTLSDNAALRYWAAFSEMQDSAITSDQADQLKLILAGTAPYQDDAYKELLKRNAPALEVMARGTKLADCDWGLDYGLRDQTPVEYVRKALELGRLNVLYAFHLSLNGDKAGSARTLAAGIRFSHDVANGGSLFATVVAKSVLVNHFRAIEGLLQLKGISSSDAAELRQALSQLGPSGLDWQEAIDRELEVISQPEWKGPMQHIRQAYVAAFADPSKLPGLQETIANAPTGLRDLMPSPKVVLEQKQDLTEQLQRVRQALR